MAKDPEVSQIDNPQTMSVVSENQKLTEIDTVHGDEALKVIAVSGGDDYWEEDEEKKLVRKIDRRLMPILCITYGVQYYDKAMLAQAALFGLRKDLDLVVGNRFTFSSSIFYLGFIVGACPAMLIAQRWPIECVAACIAFIWGICIMKVSPFSSRTRR